jgi:arylsulfate sulfotransferase
MLTRVKRIFILLTITLVSAGFLWQFDAVKDTVAPIRIDHIGLSHLPENRLRFKVEVTTNRNSDAYLKYWSRGQRDTLYSEISKQAHKHALWVTNATGSTDYTFQVVASTPSQQTISKKYPLETKAIYQATPYFTLDHLDSSFAGEIEGKYFLTQILTEPGSAVIINHKGDIVWYQPFQKGVKVSHWTPEKTVMCIVGPEKVQSSGGDEIVELDLAGNVLTHLQTGKGDMDKMVHHEVRTDKNGNIYALTFDKKVFDLSSVGGARQDTVKGDGIVIFSRQGKKLWEWTMLDHLDPLSDPQIMKNKKDWVHANSVFREEDGNFLISFRDLNQVWKVDFKTGDVLWKLGEKGDFPLADNELFAAQHYAHINARGELMTLDNGVKKGISRALSFKLNASGKKAKKEIDIPLAREYYSTAKGNAQLFGKDKVLYCITDPRVLLVTDLKGKILWKVQVGGDPYRIEETPGFARKEVF